MFVGKISMNNLKLICLRLDGIFAMRKRNAAHLPAELHDEAAQSKTHSTTTFLSR
jgi:hypothetical protein